MSSEYMKRTLRAGELRKREALDAVEGALGAEEAVVEEEGPRDRQVLIRVSEVQRGQWQAAAEADGLSVSEWLRQMADSRWREVFTCAHPLEKRQVYPWSEFCLECGTKIR
jgi:hypothetical protein